MTTMTYNKNNDNNDSNNDIYKTMTTMLARMLKGNKQTDVIFNRINHQSLWWYVLLIPSTNCTTHSYEAKRLEWKAGTALASHWACWAFKRIWWTKAFKLSGGGKKGNEIANAFASFSVGQPTIQQNFRVRLLNLLVYCTTFCLVEKTTPSLRKNPSPPRFFSTNTYDLYFLFIRGSPLIKRSSVSSFLDATVYAWAKLYRKLNIGRGKN